MTISSENNVNRYTADGVQTAFTGTFKIYDQTHVKVLVDDIVQTLGTDYTVSGVGNDSGFTVTFTTAPASGKTVTLLLNPPHTQLTDYTSLDPFPAETHERALDLLTQQMLKLKEKLGRLIGFKEKSTYKDITVDDPVAGRFLRWKADLSGLENIDIAQQGSLAVSDYMKTVLDDQNAAAARATLGAAGKVGGATAGNFASLDANGDLQDSGQSLSSLDSRYVNVSGDNMSGLLILGGFSDADAVDRITLNPSDYSVGKPVLNIGKSGAGTYRISMYDGTTNNVGTLLIQAAAVDVTNGNLTVAGNKAWHDGDAAKSLAARGYQKFPSGLIIQWGFENVSGGPSSYSFTFPITFPNAVLAITKAKTVRQDFDEYFDPITTTGATINQPNAGGVVPFYWIAIGY